MKRSTFAFSAAAAVLLLSRTAGAQLPVGNANDIQLHNGGDIIYIYTDPSIGPQVGTSGVPDFGTNDYYWKVWPKEVLRHCSGQMEITNLDIFDFDEDFTTLEAGTNNTALADMFIGLADLSAPPLIQPDQVNGTLLTFGPATAGNPLFKNNVFLSPAPCPPPGFIYGYELEVDLLGGVATNVGILITADGATDTVFTSFLPGNGHDHTAGGACGTGDGADPDSHSSALGGGQGETQFDSNNDGVSDLGGYGQLGVTTGGDPNDEVAEQYIEFRENTTVLAVNSNVGAAIPVEEGLAGVNYKWTAAAGGTFAPREYAAQGIGRPGRVIMTLSPQLPACINFLSSKLALNPADPLFLFSLNLVIGNVLLCDNDDPSTGTVFDDGRVSWPNFPLGGHPASPVTGSIKLQFQALFDQVGPGITLGQATQMNLRW